MQKIYVNPKTSCGNVIMSEAIKGGTMKALIFDGSYQGDPHSDQIRSSFQEHLPGAESVILRQQRIGNCAGDFLCWVRSPGVCMTDDANRQLASRIVDSDLLIYLTPVTFGGYASPLKCMVDHQIQNSLPYFNANNKELHHQPRYQRYPNLLVVGWMDAPDAQSEAIFRHLVRRNALNTFTPKAYAGIVVGEPSPSQVSEQIPQWFAALERQENLPSPALPRMPAPQAGDPVRRAVLLVGSPRLYKSTSASLGGYLMRQMESRGVQTETILVYPQFSSKERAESALQKLDSADLVILAFPLYVDSLPGALTAALELIAEHRSKANAILQSEQRFAAMANCGYPEAAHNLTALAICAQFSQQAGFRWAGGLSLGGGEGLIHGVPLENLRGSNLLIKKSLDLTAAALTGGDPVPAAAVGLLAKSIVPSWLYRLIGHYRWKRQAKTYGVQENLSARPYESLALK